jgi:hypothetical protein
MAGELRTYGDASIVRDVQKEIELLTPVENLLQRSMRKSTARAMVHQWQDDTLAAAGSAAGQEYVAFTPDTLSTPSLRTNLVEHVIQSVSVTNAQQLATHESGEDEWARQVAKKMKDWSNAAEFDLLRSSLVSGISGTAPRMNGVIKTISTNATSHTSGTIFSESIFVGLLSNTWENSNGDAATDVLVGSLMKRKISSFTTGITKNIDVSANKSGTMVQLYESDFGTVNVHLHRYIQLSADATARVLGVNMAKLYMAQLAGKGVTMTDQGVRATSRDAVIDGYITLENRNEATGFFSDGFLKSA